MPVLQPSEYDASYFDGKSQSLQHNAGYSKYERWYRIDGNIQNSTGEFWKDKAVNFLATHNLSNYKVLEIGCAKGFLVQDLRDMGIDAYGIDVSSYAIGEADPAVAPYLSVGDARTYLSNYNNREFDVVFSMRFLECIDVSEVQALVDEMNRITKRFQIHEIDEQPNPLYYVAKPITEWTSDFNWKNGTYLISRESGQVIVV
jgi:2-polyprenyl-3-methyl-5-hydroxy-6-metoxy-1,4-benzoquinol methylase